MRHIILISSLIPLAACATTPRIPKSLNRCIWVDRWDYRTEQDIERVIKDCARAGFSAVMFQVRGNGTVAFRSAHEPWYESFGFQDPGFDPLLTAISAARSNSIELHAWINLIPGWNGAEPPTFSGQLWNSRPEWFLTDSSGRREPMSAGRYLGLNPCLPEVRRHLASLCSEIVTTYPVDGLHLDYLRFTDVDHAGDGVYPTDQRSLDLFTAETGAARDDIAAFAVWKTDAITALLREIRHAVRAGTDNTFPLTTAVLPDPNQARSRHHQDWPRWLQERLVDGVFPMNYSDDDHAFAAQARAGIAVSSGMPVVMGIGAFKHNDPQQTVGQIEAALDAGAAGVAVFNYRTLFDPDHVALRQRLTTWNLLSTR